MKADIKKRWVAALRSGKYKQGRLALNNRGESFCCLGVLCELAVRSRVTTRGKPDTWGEIPYGKGFQNYNTLPTEVIEWAGLRSEDPEMLIDGLTLPLSDINDKQKRRFSTIARLIEEQL